MMSEHRTYVNPARSSTNRNSELIRGQHHPKAYDLYREPCPHQKTITPSSVLHARRPAIAARSRKSVVASKNLSVRGVDRRVVSANILSRRWHKTLLLEKGFLQKTLELHIPAPQYIPHLALIQYLPCPFRCLWLILLPVRPGARLVTFMYGDRSPVAAGMELDLIFERLI